MANIAISHLKASGWTAIKPPAPCTCLVVESEDDFSGFFVRTDEDDSNTERYIRPGGATTFETAEGARSFQPEDTIAYVMAEGDGVLVLTAGMGMQMSIAEAEAEGDEAEVTFALYQTALELLAEMKRTRRAMEILINQEVRTEDAA